MLYFEQKSNKYDNKATLTLNSASLFFLTEHCPLQVFLNISDKISK